MIEFKKELKKYEPVLEIEDIEEDVADDGTQDILELLQYLAKERPKVGGKK